METEEDLGFVALEDDPEEDLGFVPVEDSPSTGFGDLRISEERTSDRERIRREGEERLQLPEGSINSDPVYNELSQLNYGVTKGLANLSTGVNQLGAVAADVILPAFPGVSKALQERARLSQSGARDIERTAEEQPGSPIARAIGEGAVSVLPAITPWGVTGGAIAGGIQGGLSSITEAQESYERKGDPDARSKAYGVGAISGLITSAITKLGGKTGPEALKELIKSGSWKSLAKDIPKGAAGESAEETWDQVGQSALEYLTYNPEKTIEEAIKETTQAGIVGGVLGAGASTVGGVAGRLPPIPEIAKTALPKSAALVADQTKDISEAEKSILEINERAPELAPEAELEPLNETKIETPKTEETAIPPGNDLGAPKPTDSPIPITTAVEPEPQLVDLSQTDKKESEAAFDRAYNGDESAFDELDSSFRGESDPETELERRSDPNTIRTPEAFEKMFEAAFSAKDFDTIINAIKATSDVSIWKPYLKKIFGTQKTDPVSAAKSEWFRHVFAGTIPPDAVAPKASPPGTAAPGPRPTQSPPPPPQPPPSATRQKRIEVEPIPGGGAKSPFQIIKDFSDSIKKAVRTRRLKVNQLGVYSPGSTMTASKFAADLDTVAHELAGHWVDDKHGIGKPWMHNTVAPFDTELSKFWFYGSARPSSPMWYKRAEGIAEFIRAYVVNPKQAVIDAPNFHAYFTKTVPADVLKSIDKFGVDVRTWAGEDPLRRSGLSIRMEPDSGFKRFWQSVTGKGYGFEISPVDRIALWFNDRHHYSKKAFRQAMELQGKDVKPSQDFERLVDLLSGLGDRFKNQLEFGLARFKPDIGPDGHAKRLIDEKTKRPMNLEWLVDWADTKNKGQFDQDLRDASAYMVAQRTIEKSLQTGKQRGLSGIGAGIISDVKAAKETIKRVESDPKLKAKLDEAARRYRLWADANINMLVESGRLKRADADAIKARNEFYVDMHRLSEDFDSYMKFLKGNKLGNAGQNIKKFRGSELEIANVYHSLLNQTRSIQKESFRNNAMAAFVSMLENVRQLHGPGLVDLDQFGSKAHAGEPNAIKVFRNGVPEFWKFETQIFNSLKGVSDFAHHPVIDVLSFLPELTKYFITRSPQFIMRNVVRDSFERSVLSESGSKPWDILKGYSKKELSDYELFGGGQFGNYIKNDREWNKELKKAINKYSASGNTVLNPLNWWEKWSKTSEMSEKVGRMAEYRRAYQKAKTKLNYSDFEAHIFAASEARGLMDFAKMGTVMRVVNRLVPFSGPAVRGLVKSYQSMHKNPAAFAAKWSAYIMLPTIATMLMAKQDDETWEEYVQFPAYQRDFFWNFKAGGKWWAIPKPHLIGVLSSGVERGVFKLLGEKRALEGYGISLAAASLPVSDPAEAAGPLKTFIELQFNRDSFRDRDIIPIWERDLKLELRKTKDRASGSGKSVSSALNATGMEIDPRQVDHVIKSFGGLGTSLTDLTSPTLSKKDAAKRIVPFVKESPGINSRDVQWVFDWAKKNGKISTNRIQDISDLRKDILDEKDPEEKKELSRIIREKALELREEIEAE